VQKITTKNYAELSQKTAEIIAECIKNKPRSTIVGWGLSFSKIEGFVVEV
jgi:hypothetical protein